MSTDHIDFDLAPSNGAATATRERPDPTPAKPSTKASKKKPANPDAPLDTTLGGVLIPGGIITGLIALCWMTHHFGLGPVIFGLLACAAAASAALAVKTRNAIRKATGRNSGGLRSAGGAGPGTRGFLGSAGSARNPSGALSSTGRTGAGPRSLGSAGRSSGASIPSQARRSGSGFGTTGGAPKPTGPASRKPAGLGPFAKTAPSAAGGRNSLPKQSGPALGKSAAATGGPGKSLLGGGSKASGAGTGSGGKGGSRRGLLGRKGSTSGGSLGAGSSSAGNGKPGSHKKGKNTGTGGGSATGKAGAAASRGRLGAFLRRNPTAQTQPATAKGHDKKKPTPGTPTSPSTPQQIKAAKKAAKAAKNNKGHNGTNPKPSNIKAKKKPTTSTKKNNGKSKKPWKSPTTNPHRAPIGPARRGAYWAGKKLRKHTTRKTRMRIKKVVGPVRSTVRNFSRFASPLLAHTVRFASRAILHSHMLLGTIRYTSAGPNWLRPFTRLLHVVSSPVARLVAASGSWGWMNSWIYRNTTPQPGTTKPAPTRPTVIAGPHRPVTSPAATTAGTSTKGSTTVSSIQHTMPLIYAAEAVRAAGVMLLVNPAENMRGYEATMRQLADVQHAIGQVVQAAALSTQENFKVNPAVSDAYFDTAGYAHTVGERLGSIPDLFRIIHAEQIENIENPTPQGAKWDINANNLGE